MNPRLSIIIPCYNCEKTLEEAVNSCYTQGIGTDEFEVVMVDDGSTDGTRALMERIATEHGNIRLIFHEKNRGGGAARNTGIASARGRLIYCLDSDNILAPTSLEMLIKYLDEKKADGVSFYERRFFSGTNVADYSPSKAHITDRPIVLADLFTDPSILLDNFLFTKESYIKTQGFPEHHGFDTQSFEMRYLKTGNRVFVCPGSIFYHRQMVKGESYFEREYNKGNFSLFYFYAIEDIFELLSPVAQETIARYDIFRKSSLKDNLLKELKTLHAKNALFARAGERATGATASFAEGILQYRNRTYTEALRSFELAATQGLSSPVVRFCTERSRVAQSGTERNLVEKTVQTYPEFRTQRRRLYRKFERMPFAGSIRKMINLIKKWL